MKATVRETFKYKLYPTAEQKRALDTVLYCCRTLYNTALEERKTAWERCGVSVDYYQQLAELPDLKTGCPEYGEVHAQVLQDVLLRLDRSFQAFISCCKLKQEGKFKGKVGYPQPKRRRRGWAVSASPVQSSSSRMPSSCPVGAAAPERTRLFAHDGRDDSLGHRL